jgi:hypothetical protein
MRSSMELHYNVAITCMHACKLTKRQRAILAFRDIPSYGPTPGVVVKQSPVLQHSDRLNKSPVSLLDKEKKLDTGLSMLRLIDSSMGGLDRSNLAMFSSICMRFLSSFSDCDIRSRSSASLCDTAICTSLALFSFLISRLYRPRKFTNRRLPSNLVSNE